MKRKFTKEEVQNLVWENAIETDYGENRRWSRTNITIVEFNKKFYELYWEEGLTEYQENEYEAQEADEMEQIEKTIIVKRWVKKES
jgi:hypothetical protein